MATRSASLPIERSYLVKAWLAVTAIVVITAVVFAIALAATRSTPAGGTGLGPVPDYGPVQQQSQPIVVNGDLCGQCR